MKWQKSELDYLKNNYHKFSTAEIKQHLYDYFWNDRNAINKIPGRSTI